jgi:hypothetical protein
MSSSAAEPKAAAPNPKPDAPKTDGAGLFDMKLGKVLLAELVKDPESIAQLVSQAVENAEAPACDAATKAAQSRGMIPRAILAVPTLKGRA